MSYSAVIPLRRPPLVRPLAPSRFGPGLRGLGTMLDNDLFTSAWYLPLVAVVNKITNARSYAWAPYKYLSNWDALDYNMSFTNYTPTTEQGATLYQWDGTQWLQTNVQSGV